MLFNSYGFIFVFLPVAFLGFFLLARLRHAYAAAWLALASLLFYGFWNPAYVGLLLGSVVFNYTFGTWIAKAVVGNAPDRKRNLLAFAVAVNLSLLGYFKYANFFIASVDRLTGADFNLGAIILPLGISFFTFTQIAFLVDTYEGKVKEYNFTHYVLFATYFPHLIAGPLLHHKDMMPQFALAPTYRIHWDNFAKGLMLFALGLCKKVLWADSLAPFAQAIFDGVQQGIGAGTLPTTYEAWSGALAYTLQLYFDFSGYTDMALGVALMFNINLPCNFNSPYKATSIIEFWRRWHITLSTFLRDYLYIPLGGNRHGKPRRYLNLMATMLLGGLWHGAGWTFVIWGGLHGVFLAVNHLWRESIPASLVQWVPKWIATPLAAALTFLSVVSAWVLFRAADITQAQTMLKAMFGLAARPVPFDAVLHGQLLLVAEKSGRDLLLLVVAGLLWVWLLPNSTRVRLLPGGTAFTLAQAAVVLAALMICIDRFGHYSPFLYFQF